MSTQYEMSDLLIEKLPRKVALVGKGGEGKSTLAKVLGQALLRRYGLPYWAYCGDTGWNGLFGSADFPEIATTVNGDDVVGNRSDTLVIYDDQRAGWSNVPSNWFSSDFGAVVATYMLTEPLNLDMYGNAGADKVKAIGYGGDADMVVRITDVVRTSCELIFTVTLHDGNDIETVTGGEHEIKVILPEPEVEDPFKPVLVSSLKELVDATRSRLGGVSINELGLILLAIRATHDAGRSCTLFVAPGGVVGYLVERVIAVTPNAHVPMTLHAGSTSIIDIDVNIDLSRPGELALLSIKKHRLGLVRTTFPIHLNDSELFDAALAGCQRHWNQSNGLTAIPMLRSHIGLGE